MVGVASTVNGVPALGMPPTVTTTSPLVAPAGTGTTMLVADQLVVAAVVPLKVTVLEPLVAPKLVPVIVTDVPTAALVGVRVVMVGVASTVNGVPALGRPPTVTTTLPVVAPAGTDATMLVADQLDVVAVVPLNLTVLDPLVAPKLVPVSVTDAPTAPLVGARFVIEGDTGVPVCGRNATTAACQRSAAPSDAVAAALPAVAWIASATISAVEGAASIVSRVMKPVPAVIVLRLCVEMTPSSRSPLVVVVALPLSGAVSEALSVALTSSAFVVATPAYSRIANRSEMAVDAPTVTVLAPAAMFCA
jgi:hypothetical protein